MQEEEGSWGQVPHRTTREEPVCPITALQAPRGKAPPTWQGDSAVAQGTPWSPATRGPLSVGADLPPLPTRPSRAAEHGWQAVPARLTMDQDYERRLLRQIVIQNENTMPCVSAGASAPAPSCPVEPVWWGWWGPRCAQPLGFVP